MAARLRRVEGQIGHLAGGDGDHHGLADRPRHAEDVGGGDAGERGRHHHSGGGLEAGEAERVGALAQMVGHRAHRVLADRGDVGQDHDAHDQAGRQHVESRQPGNEVAQQRRDEQQREIAVDHRRYARQQLEQWLDRLAHLERRILAQIDGERGPGRDRDQESDARDHEGARQKRQDAVSADWRTAASTGCRSENRPSRHGGRTPGTR